MGWRAEARRERSGDGSTEEARHRPPRGNGKRPSCRRVWRRGSSMELLNRERGEREIRPNCHENRDRGVLKPGGSRESERERSGVLAIVIGRSAQQRAGERSGLFCHRDRKLLTEGKIAEELRCRHTGWKSWCVMDRRNTGGESWLVRAARNWAKRRWGTWSVIRVTRNWAKPGGVLVCNSCPELG